MTRQAGLSTNLRQHSEMRFYLRFPGILHHPAGFPTFHALYSATSFPKVHPIGLRHTHQCLLAHGSHPLHLCGTPCNPGYNNQWAHHYMLVFQWFTDSLRIDRLRQYLHEGVKRWSLHKVAKSPYQIPFFGYHLVSVPKVVWATIQRSQIQWRMERFSFRSRCGVNKAYYLEL